MARRHGWATRVSGGRTETELSLRVAASGREGPDRAAFGSEGGRLRQSPFCGAFPSARALGPTRGPPETRGDPDRTEANRAPPLRAWPRDGESSAARQAARERASSVRVIPCRAITIMSRFGPGRSTWIEWPATVTWMGPLAGCPRLARMPSTEWVKVATMALATSVRTSSDVQEATKVPSICVQNTASRASVGDGRFACDRFGPTDCSGTVAPDKARGCPYEKPVVRAGIALWSGRFHPAGRSDGSSGEPSIASLWRTWSPRWPSPSRDASKGRSVPRGERSSAVRCGPSSRLEREPPRAPCSTCSLSEATISKRRRVGYTPMPLPLHDSRSPNRRHRPGGEVGDLRGRRGFLSRGKGFPQARQRSLPQREKSPHRSH